MNKRKIFIFISLLLVFFGLFMAYSSIVGISQINYRLYVALSVWIIGYLLLSHFYILPCIKFKIFRRSPASYLELSRFFKVFVPLGLFVTSYILFGIARNTIREYHLSHFGKICLAPIVRVNKEKKLIAEIEIQNNGNKYYNFVTCLDSCQAGDSVTILYSVSNPTIYKKLDVLPKRTHTIAPKGATSLLDRIFETAGKFLKVYFLMITIVLSFSFIMKFIKPLNRIIKEINKNVKPSKLSVLRFLWNYPENSVSKYLLFIVHLVLSTGNYVLLSFGFLLIVVAILFG